MIQCELAIDNLKGQTAWRICIVIPIIEIVPFWQLAFIVAQQCANIAPTKWPKWQWCICLPYAHQLFHASIRYFQVRNPWMNVLPARISFLSEYTFCRFTYQTTKHSPGSGGGVDKSCITLPPSNGFTFCQKFRNLQRKVVRPETNNDNVSGIPS